MDAIVYGRGALNANIQQLLNTLTPGRSMVVENVTSAGEMSISRCDHKASPGAVSYVLSQPTPKAINNCSLAPRVPPASGPVPAGVPNVRINELNTDSPDANKMVYIELIGNSSTSLDGLTLVAYSGQNANKASYVLDLTGQKVNAKGFFLIGNSNVQGADLSQPDNILRSDGLNALVLYKLNASGFVKDQTQAFSNGSVVDFIVYGNISTSVNSSISLLDIFATGQKQIYENDQNLHHDESISRCSPHSIGDMMAFSVTIPTPGAPNNCDRPTVLINEINADSPGSDDKEFIELWDGGSGNTALNWIVLVLYNGANGQAYYTLDLTNERTDANGFYIVGGANVANVDHVLSLAGRSVSIIQNGPDAIALYRGHSSNFTTGMSPTKKGLIDAVVYGTNDAQNRVLLDSLLQSGQMQINEDPEFLNGDESISRCSCSTPMDYQCFTLTTPSPKTGNNCTNPTPRPSTTVAVPTGDLPKVVINEVNVDQPGLDITEFIELAGPPGASLAGYSLVLFSYSVPLKRASVSAQFNLNNYRISNTGLFLISNHTRFSVKTDYVLPIPGIIENGIEAIVLYDNRQLTISDAMQPTQQGVMDAIVHCTSVWDRDLGKQLITTLGLKGSAAIVEDATFHRDDESINRCDGNDTMDLSSFKLSLVTPGKPNTCPKIKFARPVQLKLINADCREWRNNVSLLFVFKENVAYSINEQCNCGFSADYIADLKVHCGGSVVLVFSIIGTSEEHIKNVYSSFIEYVNSSKSIKVAGHQYNLESCIDNKCYIQPSGQTGKPGQLGVSVGVGLGCAAALIVVIIVTVICIKKRRSGTLHFQMARFDDTDDDLEDEWVGGAPASFNNPLYSKILS
ncbi:uncharacterized protein LOC106164224 [Lingula anatina]|uniref:Uncharacterized protein LOC106164224 n=1 Tax=Lingula anatina TaxID=7574 RepID=A0A1S3IGY1_LINAN|nr:uncharacterized protein LOC106164224 [Lingula anatina]|eukprot:XP_013397520.1 uncharacterized protein LOC106164224 [Lingula anatina]